MYRLVTRFGSRELERKSATIEELALLVFHSLYDRGDGRFLVVVKEGVPGLVRERDFIWSGMFDQTYAESMETVRFDAFAETLERRSLDVMELYRRGENLWKTRKRWWTRRFGDWNGEGPVPGVRKRRGSRRCCRHPKTTAEMRLSFIEDDIAAPRPERKAKNLMSAWDDIFVRRERNWKSQHKGLKSWDKPRL